MHISLIFLSLVNPLYWPDRYFAEEAPITSVFVRDLPADITAEKIEEAFARFGAVRNGVRGVSLKFQKGKDNFAFVEFEEAAAMHAAIEGNVLIDGQKARIQLHLAILYLGHVAPPLHNVQGSFCAYGRAMCGTWHLDQCTNKQLNLVCLVCFVNSVIGCFGRATTLECKDR